MDVDEKNDLRASIIARVDRWLKREAPRVRDEDTSATIKFTISNPCGDDDGKLALTLLVEETNHELLGEEFCLTLDLPFGARTDTRDE